jgi:hypothetical protein
MSAEKPPGENTRQMVARRTGPAFFIAQKPPAYLVRRVPGKTRATHGKMVEEHWRMNPITNEWECIQSEPQEKDTDTVLQIPWIGDVDWHQLREMTQMLKEEEENKTGWEHTREKPDLQRMADLIWSEKRRKRRKSSQFSMYTGKES